MPRLRKLVRSILLRIKEDLDSKTVPVTKPQTSNSDLTESESLETTYVVQELPVMAMQTSSITNLYAGNLERQCFVGEKYLEFYVALIMARDMDLNIPISALKNLLSEAVQNFDYISCCETLQARELLDLSPENNQNSGVFNTIVKPLFRCAGAIMINGMPHDQEQLRRALGQHVRTTQINHALPTANTATSLPAAQEVVHRNAAINELDGDVEEEETQIAIYTKLLLEYGIKNGGEPRYQEIGTGELSNFRYRVKMTTITAAGPEEWVEYGEAGKKKGAKHRASKRMCQRLGLTNRSTL